MAAQISHKKTKIEKKLIWFQPLHQTKEVNYSQQGPYRNFLP